MKRRTAFARPSRFRRFSPLHAEMTAQEAEAPAPGGTGAGGSQSESYYRYYATFPGTPGATAASAAAGAEKQCTSTLKGQWTPN
jgi:hypothetical protein